MCGMRAVALALALASASALRPPPAKLDLTLDAESIKKSFMVAKGLTNKTFNASAAFRNYKRAAAAVINATKSGDDALLRTVPARTGIGMLPAPQLDTLRVPRDGIAAVGLGSDLAAPPLAMCGAGVGICGPGLCCSQAGFCARDSYSCDGTCQRAYSGMDAPCNGKFPDPVPKGDWTEAAPGGVCGAYVGKYCGVGSCCTQFGWCAPDYLDAAPPGSNKTLNGDLTAGINHWCSIGSCNLAASPYSPTCAAAHKLLKPAVRKFKLVLEEGYVNPDGVQKKAILVNGQFPGPTLEVNLGDQVVVEVVNKLDQVTTVHWHGILQTNSVGEDGTQWISQDPIPGLLQTTGLPQPDSDPNAPQTFVYSFQANNPGIMWWHSHYEVQYADGARGALIVKAPPSLAQVQDYVDAEFKKPKPPPPGAEHGPFIPPLEYEATPVVMLFDNYHQPYTELQAWYESTATNPDGVEPVPDGVLINGIGQGYCGKPVPGPVNATGPGGPLPCNWPVINAKAGPCSKPRTKLQIINGAAFAPIDVFVDHVATWVVEIDSIAINPVYVKGQLRLNVGQRLGVAICSDDIENRAVLLRASMDQAAFYQPSVAPVSSAIINFGPGPWDGVVPKAAPWLPLPRNLARQAAFQQATSVFGPLAFDRGVQPPPPTTTLTVTIAAGTVDNGDANAFFMNDISFVPPDTPSLYSRLLGNPTNVGNGPNAAPGEVGFNVQNYTTGSVVDVIINNHDGGQHPIHLHGAFFTVMAQGDEGAGDYAGQPLEALVLRDVHTIPANSYIVLRVPIFNTMPMFLHCHIEPHLGVGLGMVMNSLAVGRG